MGFPGAAAFPHYGKIRKNLRARFGRRLADVSRHSATLMGKVLLALTIPMLACLLGAAAAPPPEPDAQGWNGAGWYVTSTASPPAQSDEVPVYILFNGPYPLQSGCLEVYDRLYSPIGTCRFLKLKPAAFAG